MFSIGNFAYIFEGGSNSLHKFDAGLNTWSIIDLPEDKLSTEPLCSSNKENGYLLINTNIYRFDPVDESYVKVTEISFTRESSEYMFCYDDFLYLGNSLRKRLQKYDLKKDTWSDASAIYVGYHVNYFYMEDKLYMVRQSTTMRIDSYDPAEDEWSFFCSVPDEISGSLGQFGANGFIYLGLGKDFRAPASHLWKYNIKDHEWTALADCPVKIMPNVSFEINGKGYFISNYKKEFWEYDTSIQ